MDGAGHVAMLCMHQFTTLPSPSSHASSDEGEFIAQTDGETFCLHDFDAARGRTLSISLLMMSATSVLLVSRIWAAKSFRRGGGSFCLFVYLGGGGGLLLFVVGGRGLEGFLLPLAQHPYTTCIRLTHVSRILPVRTRLGEKVGWKFYFVYSHHACSVGSHPCN